MVTSVSVKDAAGATQTVNTLPPLGQAAAAASLPMVHASDDPIVAATGATTDAAVTTTAGGTLTAMIRGLKNILLAGTALFTLNPLSTYASPDGRKPVVFSSMAVLFSDDFGGSAINAALWDVIDGGLAATTSGVAVGQLAGTPLAPFTQAAIGSGTTGMTDVVSASSLKVSMNTTNGAERWYLSRTIFAGAEDVTLIVKASQRLAANSIFFGLVEVEATTGVPILNPNLANEFTNRGGVDIGKTTSNFLSTMEAVADSSGTVATINGSNGSINYTTNTEVLLEFHAEDVICSQTLPDALGFRTGQLRISTQCPNDGKAYKLLIRFKNVSAPGSNTTVTIERVLVVDSQEQRVEIASGRGDNSQGKGIAVNLVGSNSIQTSSITHLGGMTIQSTPLYFNSGSQLSTARYTAAATTNGQLIVAGGRIYGGTLHNLSASVRYFKFYDKATTPTVGTDTPKLTIPLQPNSVTYLADALAGVIGLAFQNGIGIGITGALADADTTAVTAGDVQVNIIYN